MMRRKSLLIFFLAASLFLITAKTIVHAQGENPVSNDEINAIAGQLYCPICENVPLDVCPSQACADWRELIRQYLSEGWTADEIKDYFSTQYGWNVLTLPPPVGINWFLYLAPPTFVVLGIIIVVALIGFGKKMASAQATPKELTDIPSQEFLDQVEKDLKSEENND
jgi:cytochrome c-type biogenesis protein CcmH